MQATRSLIPRITVIIVSGVLISHAEARVGWTEGELVDHYGKMERANATDPAETAYGVDLDAATTVQFGCADGHVVYAFVSGTRLTPQRVTALIQRLGPLADGAHGGWRIDSRQAAMYPPLVGCFQRRVFVPTGLHVRQVTQRKALVRHVYNGSGQELARQILGTWQDTRMQPELRGITAAYDVLRGVSRTTLVRSDQHAYAVCDFTYDSTVPFTVTREVLIADADTYWHIVLKQVRDAVRHRPSGSFSNTGVLHYERVLASKLTPAGYQQTLVDRYLRSFVLATDNPHVDLEYILDSAKIVDHRALSRLLAKGLRTAPVDSQMRRIALIDRLRLTDAIPEVTYLLSRTKTDSRVRRAAVRALIALAHRFPVPPPSDSSNYHQWRNWSIKARKSNQRTTGRAGGMRKAP